MERQARSKRRNVEIPQATGQNQELRRECLKFPWIARKVFEETGAFQNMPASVEIRVLEDNKGARDNLHIIALPPAGNLDTQDKFDPNIVWLGCWNLWKQ